MQEEESADICEQMLGAKVKKKVIINSSKVQIPKNKSTQVLYQSISTLLLATSA